MVNRIIFLIHENMCCQYSLEVPPKNICIGIELEKVILEFLWQAILLFIKQNRYLIYYIRYLISDILYLIY